MPWNLSPPVAGYLFGYLVFVGIRGIYDRPDRRAVVVLRRQRLSDFVAMIWLGVGMMLIPPIFVFTSLLDPASYPPLLAAQLLGLGVLAAGLVLFWRSHADLGYNFSRTLEIHEAHVLVVTGTYRTVRHPMYAAIWLVAAGQALILPNWIAGLSGLVGFAPLYFLRTPREEELLSEEFGEAYDQYARSTPRVLPAFTRKR